MSGILASSCVFALKNKTDLTKSEGSDVVAWHENRPWSTAKQMLSDSVHNGTLLLVLLADSVDFGPVTHFGQLVTVDLDGDGTVYKVGGLRRLREPIPLQDVVVKSTAKPISIDDIRSYKLCVTPRSLFGSAATESQLSTADECPGGSAD